MRFICLLPALVSGWWYGIQLTLQERDSLLQAGCFHGDYKNDLTIASCARPFLTQLNVSLNQGLCVVENMTTFQLTASTEHSVVLAASQFAVLSSTKESSHLYPQACLQDNVITVPLSPYAPPAAISISSLPSAQLANPVITQAVAAVSADSLRSSVTFLSTKYYTRNSLSLEALEASQWLTDQYRSFGFTVTTFQWNPDYAPVVIAELKGVKQPEEIVIVGGHYDSRSVDVYSPTARAPGADDNGSGTANLLEIARVIGTSKLQFQYTLRLCSFAGEEQGLLGSRAYAADQKKQGTKIIAMLNGDMLGYQLPGKPVSLGMKDRFVAPWLLSVVNSLTALYVPELPIAFSPSCCSDHQAFTENGFPAVGFFENPGSASDYPHYHKETDLVQYLNFDQMRLESAAMLASAMTFAVPA